MIPWIRVENYKWVATHQLSDIHFEPAGDVFTLSRSSASDRTRKAEPLLGLNTPRLYFYLGYACPKFGNIVFAFDFDVLCRMDGSASPFDSGGWIRVGSHGPFIFSRDFPPGADRSIDDGRRAYFEHHKCPLGSSQSKVTTYLGSYFSSPSGYVLGEKPHTDDPTGRLLHPANEDRRCWTWEAQVDADMDWDTESGLKKVWLSTDLRDHIDKLASASQQDTEVFKQKWISLGEQRRISSWHELDEPSGSFGGIQEEIAQW